MGEELWGDEKLSRVEVGFGWNFQTTSDESRYVNITIQPDNSYEIELGEYSFGADFQAIKKTEGTLTAEVANRLRRQLAQLRSLDQSSFTTLPGCVLDHPAVEYEVGFKVAGVFAVTVIDKTCETPEAVEARRIVRSALAAFPQLNRVKLLAGSKEL